MNQPVTDLRSIRTRATIALLFLVLVGAIIVGMISLVSNHRTKQAKTPDEDATKEPDDPIGVGLVHPEEDAEQEVIAASRRARCLAEIELRLNEVRQLAKTKQSNDHLVKDLLVNDLGRRIAGNLELIEIYMALQDEPAGDSHLIDTAAAKLDSLKSSADFVRGYYERNRFEGITRSANEVVSNLSETRAAVERQQRRLRGLTQRAEQLPLQQSSLESAINTYESQLASQQDSRLARIRQQVRQEQSDREQQQMRDIARKIAAAEREIADSRRRVQLLDADTRRFTAQKAVVDRQLEQQFQRDITEIRTLLKPFITPGRTQHLYVNGYKIDDDPTVRPVSFSRLEGLGYLESDRKTLMNFWRSTSAHNDRPLGSFPDAPSGHIGFESALPRVQRAQQLLKKYGSLLVRKGMLSP